MGAQVYGIMISIQGEEHKQKQACEKRIENRKEKKGMQ